MRHFIRTFMIFVFSVILIYISHDELNRRFQKSSQIFLPPPKGLENFSFGYQEAIADSLWLRVIQDFDFCEKETSGECRREKSWVYQMLDRITDLAPRFRMPYALGAVNLSVLLNDIEGATIIFEKGFKQLPNDWALAYRGAYHYLFELNQPIRAADLLIQAGKNGAPEWVYALAAKLYTQNGQDLFAKSLLHLLENEGVKNEVLDKIRRRIKESEAGKSGL